PRKEVTEIVNLSDEISEKLSPEEEAEKSILFKDIGPQAGSMAIDIKKHMHKTALGGEMKGLTEGNLDTDNLSTYMLGNTFEQEIKPGRISHRILFVFDTSGSMGDIKNPSDSMYHAARIALRCLLAHIEVRGVEIGVMVYG